MWQWDTCGGYQQQCTCPPSSLSVRVGYDPKWISGIPVPAASPFTCDLSLTNGVNPNPTYNPICQCQARLSAPLPHRRRF